MADRSLIEEKLLSHQFPVYRDKVRKLISNDMTPNGNRVTDATVAAVWSESQPRLKDLKAFAGCGEKAEWIKAFHAGRLEADLISLLRSYFEAAWSYEKWLEGASDADLRSAQVNLTKRQNQLREWAAKKHDDFAWFNDPRCDLDIDYWTGMQGITADEAAAIALGKDPRQITAEKLRPFHKVSRSIFAETYGKLLRSAEVFVRKSGADGQISWKQFLAWAAQEEIDIPVPARESDVDEEDDLDPRVSGSFCRLLFGISAARYSPIHQDKDKQLSEWFSAIKDDLNEVGVAISEKTIRKRLKEAYDYMLSRPDWPPKPRVKK